MGLSEDERLEMVTEIMKGLVKAYKSMGLTKAEALERFSAMVTNQLTNEYGKKAGPMIFDLEWELN